MNCMKKDDLDLHYLKNQIINLISDYNSKASSLDARRRNENINVLGGTIPRRFPMVISTGEKDRGDHLSRHSKDHT